MKKISIIFIFLLIAMGLFFLPEVQAVDWTDQKNLLNTLENNQVLISVSQDGIPLAPIKIYNNNNAGNLGIFELETVTYNPEIVFSADKEIEIFVGTRENGLNGAAFDCNLWEIYSSDNQVLLTSGENGGFRNYNSGVNSMYTEMFFKPLRTGHRDITVKCSAPGINFQVLVKINNVVSGNVNTVNAIDIENEITQANDVKDEHVLIKIAQGEKIIYSQQLEGNGKKNEAGIVEHPIELRDSYEFAKGVPIGVYIATQQQGVEPGSVNYRILNYYSGSNRYSTVTRLPGSVIFYEKEGVNSFGNLSYVNTRQGNNEFSFLFQTEDYSINMRITIKIKVSSTIDYYQTVDIEEECNKAQEELNSGDLKVVMRLGEEERVTIIRDIKGEVETIRTIVPIDVTEWSFGAGKSVEIFIYFEKVNIQETWGLDVWTEGVSIKERQCGIDTKANNAFWGYMLLKNDLSTAIEGMVAVPFHFHVGSTGWFFTINILFGEEGRGGWGSFNDVLTNTDYYTPTYENVGQNDITQKASVILTVITNIGIILSVLMSAIIGLKYMLGSVEEKADYKKDMIPYLIGACLLFGVCTIVKILQAVGNSINAS